jgi:hypothetical protein
VRYVIDKLERDELLGPIAVTAPANPCEGSVSDSDQDFRKELKIMDFILFGNTDDVSKNQNVEIEKYVYINVGLIGLNDLLDWWRNREEEFRCLSRLAENILCEPATSASRGSSVAAWKQR